MGQYHKLVNLDKQEQVQPWGIGQGAKQYEQTGVAGSLSDALYLLLITSPARGGGDWEKFDGLSGRWVGDRVVVIGDYTEDGDYPDPVAYPQFGKVYSDSKEWTDISDEVKDALAKVWEL
jgi:hypothetical protein